MKTCVLALTIVIIFTQIQVGSPEGNATCASSSVRRGVSDTMRRGNFLVFSCFFELVLHTAPFPPRVFFTVWDVGPASYEVGRKLVTAVTIYFLS